MGEEERRAAEPDKITWDGHSSSAEAAARAARANISLNDQIEQIHRSKGLIQDTAKESIGPQSTSNAPITAPPVNVVSVPPQVPLINHSFWPQIIQTFFSLCKRLCRL